MRGGEKDKREVGKESHEGWCQNAGAPLLLTTPSRVLNNGAARWDLTAV